MSWGIEINCLIIEDDVYKLESILEYLRSCLGAGLNTEECHALSTASVALASKKYDLIIIDMSIYSHEPEAGVGSPVPLPSGGLDVLFEASYQSSNALSVILTQYPDIEIEGVPIPVHLASREISEKFGINVAACIQYVDGDSTWKTQMRTALQLP